MSGFLVKVVNYLCITVMRIHKISYDYARVGLIWGRGGGKGMKFPCPAYVPHLYSSFFQTNQLHFPFPVE